MKPTIEQIAEALCIQAPSPAQVSDYLSDCEMSDFTSVYPLPQEDSEVDAD